MVSVGDQHKGTLLPKALCDGRKPLLILPGE